MCIFVHLYLYIYIYIYVYIYMYIFVYISICIFVIVILCSIAGEKVCCHSAPPFLITCSIAYSALGWGAAPSPQSPPPAF